MKKVNNFDAEFNKSLRSFGYGFPLTEDEVEAFENSITDTIDDDIIPLENPLLILQGRKSITPKSNSIVSLNSRSATLMARAARDGQQLSQEVQKRMEEDKRNS